MSSRVAAFVAVALLALAAPALAQASKATERADRALDRALQRVVDTDEGPPGVIAVIQRGGDRQVHTAGVAEVGERGAPRPRMHMRLASTSKAFSGATALALVQKGKLSLDDTVGDLLPDLPSAWRRVTLQEALQHTSGIPTFTAEESFLEAFSSDPLHGPANQGKLLSYLGDAPLSFPSGSDYTYSNSDNIVVALMVEAASGLSYRKALRKYVLKPLGLGQTSLPSGPAMPAPYMHGYDVPAKGAPDDVSEIFDPRWTGASGGMVATPFNLNAFARGYVGGALFGKRVRKQQLELVRGGSEPPGPGQNRAGAGIFRYRTDCGTVFGHTGNIFGFTQLLAATKNGRRSLTVSATEQLSPSERKGVFKRLLAADEKAVCAALAR
ncbi:MAG: beta-lactamase family protein [Solirubrobacterales bacterium]|nr:beta-lactamase family protein [Solirubrobacterales bacterium]